jgi:hypothetical protein
MFGDIVRKKEMETFFLLGSSAINSINFTDVEKGVDIARFYINDSGELEVKAGAPFAVAGKETAKIFWDSFGEHLKRYFEEWKDSKKFDDCKSVLGESDD